MQENQVGDPLQVRDENCLVQEDGTEEMMLADGYSLRQEDGSGVVRARGGGRVRPHPHPHADLSSMAKSAAHPAGR